MKARLALAFLTAALVLGISLYASYRHLSADSRTADSLIAPKNQQRLLQAPFPQGRQESLSTPPPPPRVSAGPLRQPNPEPKRTLVDTTKEQLKEIERYLPQGAQVVTYPISEGNERGAVARADLLANGRVETVVVYTTSGPETEPGSRSLFVGVLAPDENRLILSSSARLDGGLIFANPRDPYTVPFVVRDVTGDSRPEVVVTSGVGASLGGALQVYSFDGSSLHQLAFADGHIFRLYYGGRGKPSQITAQGRYEERPRVYRWNGQEFTQTK